MIAVIIAGGSGTRLWPLSTPDYPKHLLKINGSDRSLLQTTYDRAQLLANKVLVVTEVGHVHHVKEQLSGLPETAFVTEPGRRGTASCIIGALAKLSQEGIDENEPVAFLHADHYIRDKEGFKYSLQLAAETASERIQMVLVGVEPDYPATGFGYIQKDGLVEGLNFVFGVHSFKEKPDHDLAQEYLKSGNYLWNCGYFVATLGTFKKAMEQHAPNLFTSYLKLANAKNQADYEKLYLELENEAIDYALIEKVPDLLVVPAAFDWMDLGSFSDIHKAVASDENGNHVHGKAVELEAVENSFIQSYDDRPVAVIGLDNVVVINSPNGILVARKDLSQKVGDISKRINA